MKARVRIEILNPTGGNRCTSLAVARRYVREGRADWEDGKIRFREEHHACLSAYQSASEVLHHGEGSGMASMKQVKGLPVAGPVVRLFTGHRSSKPVVDRSTVLLGVRPGEPIVPAAPPAWPAPYPVAP